MDWRRGLLLAGINLLAAAPMVCLLAVQEAKFIKGREQSAIPKTPPQISARNHTPGNAARLIRVQEEQTVIFNPCTLWYHFPPQVYVVQLGNLPAFLLSQWQQPCPASWSVSALLGIRQDGRMFRNDLRDYKIARRVDVALCLMIALQWFLIGALPLIRPNQWWREPGGFISACNFVAGGIALIPAVDGLSRLPALIAFVGWMWWFALLIWIPAQKSWQSTLGGLRRLSN